MKRPSINRTNKMENIMFAGTILAGLALGCSTTAMAAPKAIFLNNAIVQQDSRKVTGILPRTALMCGACRLCRDGTQRTTQSRRSVCLSVRRS